MGGAAGAICKKMTQFYLAKIQELTKQYGYLCATAIYAYYRPSRIEFINLFLFCNVSTISFRILTLPQFKNSYAGLEFIYLAY